MNANGITPERILITTDSGVDLHITPLSLFVRRAVAERCENDFPFPDKKAYEKPVPAEIALYEGATHFDENDPEYKREVRAANNNQSALYTKLVVNAAVRIASDFDAVETAYSGDLAALKALGVLPKDKHEALLMVILGQSDLLATVIQAIEGRAQLSEAEILDGMRLFRCAIQRNRTNGTAQAQESPGATEPEQMENQQPV